MDEKTNGRKRTQSFKVILFLIYTLFENIVYTMCCLLCQMTAGTLVDQLCRICENGPNIFGSWLGKSSAM